MNTIQVHFRAAEYNGPVDIQSAHYYDLGTEKALAIALIGTADNHIAFFLNATNARTLARAFAEVADKLEPRRPIASCSSHLYATGEDGMETIDHDGPCEVHDLP